MNDSMRPTPLAIVLRHAGRIVRDTLIVTALVGGGSLFVPNKFTATTSLLPPRSGSDMVGALLGVPDVGLLSRSLGLEGSSQTNIYLAVLRSGTVAGRLIQRFNLPAVYRQKDPEKVAKRLASSTAINVSNEGLIKISVTDQDRYRAADLANAYVAELDSTLQANTQRTARRKREFLERRLTETRGAVTRAENAFRDFQVKEKLPIAGFETERTAEAMADLMAGKEQRQVELNALESVSRATLPRAEELRNEIEQIDREVIKLPPATTQLARLLRELKIQEKILLVLTEEFERARILEQKDVAVVEILDLAAAPLHKSSPRRTLILAGTLLIALAANTALVLIRERVRAAA